MTGSTVTYGFHGSRNHSIPKRTSRKTSASVAPHAAARLPMRSISTTIVTMHVASISIRVTTIANPPLRANSSNAGATV